MIFLFSCKKENTTDNTEGFPVASKFTAMSSETGHGVGFRFSYDDQSKLKSFFRSFDEDYHISIETICDGDGFVRTLVTNHGTLSGNQIVYQTDSFPVTYNGNLVEKFSFLNQYGSIERFTFSYDNQDRIISVNQYTEIATNPNPSQYQRVEFIYSGENVTRVDYKLINGNTITHHNYTIYSYDNLVNPYYLMEEKYYPFLCGFNWFFPISENKPITKTYYSITNSSMPSNGISDDYIYELREDGYPRKQDILNGYQGYYMLYE